MSCYFDPATPPVAQGTYYVAINVTGIGNTAPGHAGTNTVVFDGRVSATQTLTPGGYSVGLAATNTAARASATSSLSFTIAK